MESWLSKRIRNTHTYGESIIRGKEAKPKVEPPTLLLVDDNQINLWLLSTCLGRRNCEIVDEAQNRLKGSIRSKPGKRVAISYSWILPCQFLMDSVLRDKFVPSRRREGSVLRPGRNHRTKAAALETRP
jgi:hypothetical protein